MRNMSFMLTTEAMRARTKTVTRRLGWDYLRRGDRVRAVVKGMGLKKGQKVEAIGEIIISCHRREPLQRMIDEPEYGRHECALEGFPHLTPFEFVAMFCAHNIVTPAYAPNRIEFRHIDKEAL